MSEATPKTAPGLDSRVPITLKCAGHATMSIAVLGYFGIFGAIFILGLWMVCAADDFK